MIFQTAGSLLVTGLVLGSGPCLVSCGPLLVSYIAAAKQDGAGGFRTYLIFSATRICVYFVFGILVGLIGEHILRGILESPALGYFFMGCGVFILVVGVLLGIQKFSWAVPCRCFTQDQILRHDTRNTVIFGLLVAMAPCLPLLAVMGYIALIADSWVKGVVYMTAFGLGTVISPILFLAWGAGWLAGWMKKRTMWEKRIKMAGGVVLVYLGCQLIYSGFIVTRAQT